MPYRAQGTRLQFINLLCVGAMNGGGGERVMDVNGLDREPGMMSGSIARYLWKWLPCLVMAVVSVPSNAQTTVEYIHTDALGTPVAVTNSTGAVIERNEYEPYGKLLSGPIKDGPGFTGHVQDAATGLTYMQQRYYDPQIGRFLSVDPVTANLGTGGNFNRYWYGNNNPYISKDPDGRLACNLGDESCNRQRIKAPRDGAILFQNGRSNKDGKSTHSQKESPITTLETTTVRPDPEPSYAMKVAGNLCSVTAGTCANRPPGADYIKVSGSSYMGSGSVAFTRNSTLFVGGSVGGTPKSLVSIKPGFSIALGYLTEGGTAQDVDDVVGGASTSYGFYWGYGASHTVSSSGNAVEFGPGTGGPTLQAVEYMTPIYSRDNAE